MNKTYVYIKPQVKCKNYIALTHSMRKYAAYIIEISNYRQTDSNNMVKFLTPDGIFWWWDKNAIVEITTSDQLEHYKKLCVNFVGL